jgi:hypothetical protein
MTAAESTFSASVGLQTKTVIARLVRAIQYPAAFQFDLGRLWNTGSPAFAGDNSRGAELMLPYVFLFFALTAIAAAAVRFSTPSLE